MKLPRNLSGERLVVGFCRHWEYRRINQEGSHIVVETSEPSPSALPSRHTRLSEWGKPGQPQFY